MTTPRAARLGVLAVCSLLTGCIFTPRETDGPPDGGTTNWEIPITTTIVLQNLAAALEDENPSNLKECFTEDYRFHVDPQDSLDAGTEAEERYANWTRDDEEHAASRMFTESAEISVVFTTVTQPDETQTETSRQEDYTLTVTYESGSHINEEVVYKGRATLWMRRSDAGRWAIFRWVDRRAVQGYTTWGVIRGDYRF